MNSDTKLEATLLATTLSKLGHKCSADAVEWAYADSENAALLRWIARELLGDSVSVLTEEEADAFAELVAANPGLVDSDGNVAKPYRENAHSLEHELDEEVERDIAILQQELKELESFSALLEKQENDFGLTTQILADKIHHYAQEDEIVSEHIAKTSVVLENASLKVDVAMKELSEKIEAMISCAHSTKEETLIEAAKKTFLYQCQDELDKFLRDDESLSENLISFYEKYFDQSCKVHSDTDVASGIQSREELLDELARLTEVHAITEQQYLTAHLALQFSNAKYSAIKQFQSSAAINTRVLDATTQKLEKAVRPTQETIKEVIETQLPGLWVDLAEHSVKSAILATDHEAKVLRHERLLSDLQQFIDLLLAQQSRHQLLAIAFETEHSMIKRFVHLAESVVSELAQKDGHSRARMSWLGRPDLAADAPENRLVDSRDAVLLEVMSLLGMETAKDNGGVVYTSMDAVIAKARGLKNELEGAEVAKSVADKKRGSLLNIMSNAVKEMQILIRGYSLTSSTIHAPNGMYKLLCHLRDTANELQPLLRLAGKDIEEIARLVEAGPK